MFIITGEQHQKSISKLEWLTLFLVTFPSWKKVVSGIQLFLWKQFVPLEGHERLPWSNKIAFWTLSLEWWRGNNNGNERIACKRKITMEKYAFLCYLYISNSSLLLFSLFSERRCLFDESIWTFASTIYYNASCFLLLSGFTLIATE